jgi:dienelactone hydrolase
MMSAHTRTRLQAAALRESRAFAAVNSKAEWEQYRDPRIAALRASLGSFPEAPRDLRVVTTGEREGDGFVIRNLVYETRPGWWASANLYLPAKPPAKMPGVLISHAHHTAKTQGELQDMGMTWARSGTAVLVPDHLGHGERRQHDFRTDKDYPQPFRTGRQDYYFRYLSNLQLSAVGESLMGWMVWDLMRGIDVLLQQPTIDRGRIFLIGAVAGGGDPAGVTAALDPRVACLVPFNFGGWQPESSVLADPDRDFAWFGDGYWESTRGLRNGARDGFAHFVIVGSVAPRKLLYSHEFAWDGKADPAWPRLQRVFGFHDAADALRVAHGTGNLKGQPPESSHCTHVGAVHRKMIYPAFKEWFGMPVPEEYSNRRPTEDLLCWTEHARKELKPQPLDVVVGKLAAQRQAAAPKDADGLRKAWAGWLGGVEPPARPVVAEGKSEEVPGGMLARFALETEPGISVPMILITPNGARGKTPAVVVVASAGKAGLLKDRSAEVAALLAGGAAVCLADLRGTGESRPGSSAGRGSSRTSVSQTNLILGTPVLGGQLRDLRAVLAWLRSREGIDGKRLAVWGDSLGKTNAADVRLAVPQDLDGPAVAEPGAASLALLAGLYEEGLAVVASGGLAADGSLFAGPYLYIPHDAIVPAPVQVTDSVLPALMAAGVPMRFDNAVDAQNRTAGKATVPGDAVKWLLAKLAG